MTKTFVEETDGRLELKPAILWRNEIVHGDCLEKMKEIPDIQSTMVVFNTLQQRGGIEARCQLKLWQAKKRMHQSLLTVADIH